MGWKVFLQVSEAESDRVHGDAALIFQCQLQMFPFRSDRSRCLNLNVARDKDRLRVAIAWAPKTGDDSRHRNSIPKAGLPDRL